MGNKCTEMYKQRQFLHKRCQTHLVNLCFKHIFRRTITPPQHLYSCTFIAITSEEIGYNCTIIAINVQLQGISSDKLRKNATKKRKVYRIYSKYIYLLLHLLYREKQDFLRIFERGKRKEKLRQKKRESPQRENSLQACIIFVASRKRSETLSLLPLVHHSLVLVEIDDFEHHH